MTALPPAPDLPTLEARLKAAVDEWTAANEELADARARARDAAAELRNAQKAWRARQGA